MTKMTTMEQARRRVVVKRQLRSYGVSFKNDAPLGELRSKLKRAKSR